MDLKWPRVYRRSNVGLVKCGIKTKTHFEWLLWHWSSLGQLNLEPTWPNGLVGCKVPTDLVKISVKQATHMGFHYSIGRNRYVNSVRLLACCQVLKKYIFWLISMVLLCVLVCFGYFEWIGIELNHSGSQLYVWLRCVFGMTVISSCIFGMSVMFCWMYYVVLSCIMNSRLGFSVKIIDSVWDFSW